jgi:hypothetical protein
VDLFTPPLLKEDGEVMGQGEWARDLFRDHSRRQYCADPLSMNTSDPVQPPPAKKTKLKTLTDQSEMKHQPHLAVRNTKREFQPFLPHNQILQISSPNNNCSSCCRLVCLQRVKHHRLLNLPHRAVKQFRVHQQAQ